MKTNLLALLFRPFFVIFLFSSSTCFVFVLSLILKPISSSKNRFVPHAFAIFSPLCCPHPKLSSSNPTHPLNRSSFIQKDLYAFSLASPKTKAVRFRDGCVPPIWLHQFFISRVETCHGWSPCVKLVIFVKNFGTRRLRAARAHFFQFSFSEKCYF